MTNNAKEKVLEKIHARRENSRNFWYSRAIALQDENNALRNELKELKVKVNEGMNQKG